MFCLPCFVFRNPTPTSLRADKISCPLRHANLASARLTQPSTGDPELIMRRHRSPKSPDFRRNSVTQNILTARAKCLPKQNQVLQFVGSY